jgi:hypothetical protein
MTSDQKKKKQKLSSRKEVAIFSWESNPMLAISKHTQRAWTGGGVDNKQKILLTLNESPPSEMLTIRLYSVTDPTV